MCGCCLLLQSEKLDKQESGGGTAMDDELKIVAKDGKYTLLLLVDILSQCVSVHRRSWEH